MALLTAILASALVSSGHVKQFMDDRSVRRNARSYLERPETIQWDEDLLRIAGKFESETGWNVVWTNSDSVWAWPDLQTKNVYLSVGWIVQSDRPRDRRRLAYLTDTLRTIRQSISSLDNEGSAGARLSGIWPTIKTTVKRVADYYFTEKWFEKNGKLYKILGVDIFSDRLTIFFGRAALTPAHWSPDERILGSRAKFSKAREAGYLVAGILLLAFSAWQLAAGSWSLALTAFLANIVNGYLILDERNIRHRVLNVIQHRINKSEKTPSLVDEPEISQTLKIVDKLLHGIEGQLQHLEVDIRQEGRSSEIDRKLRGLQAFAKTGSNAQTFEDVRSMMVAAKEQLRTEDVRIRQIQDTLAKSDKSYTALNAVARRNQKKAEVSQAVLI